MPIAMKRFFFCLETLIVIISLQQLATSQTSNCPLPTDAEIKRDIVGHLQSQTGDAGTMFTVTLSEPVQYTCLATGTFRNTYISYSVIANFTSVPSRPITLVHYQRRCNSGTWGAITGDSFETSVPDNLQPTTRTDCFTCTNQLGDPHHCRQCNPPCPGSGRCTGLGASSCCSFFTTNGKCTDNCTTSDGPNFIADISTNFTCTCNLTCPSGEAPNSNCTACELRDICVRDMPCQNGGTCTLLSAPDNYTCTCAPDYTGENCTINIDDCDPNPCENGGSCFDGIDDYTCDCVDGFTGENCTINIDDCDPNPCENGGSCFDGIDDYTCDCVDGFTGKNCSTNINDCDPNSCENGGSCIDGINDYTCICVPGYTDKNCSTNINDCDPNPCQNGGSCIDGINDYTCICVPGYTDKNCSTNINDCDPNPCQNGGSCIDGINDYTCNCVPGYTDKNCSTNINDCDPNPCQNGGSCIDGINDYTCNCAGSWTSENCTFCPIDGCKICSPVIGVCSVCFDGYLLNSNGICAKSFCNQACVGKTGYELNLCMFLCYLNEWYKHAVQCGLSIPPIIPTNSSLSLSEQWKQLHDQLQNYQTIWFNEATSRGLMISPLQQQTTFSDLNDLWLDISQNAFSLQTVWQNHTRTLQPSIELEDFTNVNRDSNNATFESFNHLWSKDLSTFNEETDMNCQLRGT